MAEKFANSELMIGELFKKPAWTSRLCCGRSGETTRSSLSREIVKLLVAGPAGSTDLALRTLLLRDPPGRGTKTGFR